MIDICVRLQVGTESLIKTNLVIKLVDGFKRTMPPYTIPAEAKMRRKFIRSSLSK